MNTYIMYVGSIRCEYDEGCTEILCESFETDVEAIAFATEKSLDVVMESDAYNFFHESVLEFNEEEERDLQARTNNYEELDEFYQKIDDLTLEECTHDAFVTVYKSLVPINEVEARKCIKVYGYDFIEILSNIEVIEEI